MSGMKLIGLTPETEQEINTVEQGYDNIPYTDKEMAGFPVRYHNLTVEQKFLVDSMYESCYNMFTSKVEVGDEIENLSELIKEIQVATDRLNKLI